MSLTSTEARVAYTVTTSPQSFAVPFYFFNATDIAVVATVAGVDTTLILNTNYTVTGAGTNPSTAQVAGVTGYTGATLTIYRNASIIQPASFVPNGQFPSSTMEKCFDRMTMQVGQLELETKRSLRFPITSGEATPLTQAQRANKTLAFDAAGNPTFLPQITATVVSGNLQQVGSTTLLRALSVAGMVTGAQVSLTGYYANGDCPARILYYDASSSAADNGGTVIAPNAGSGRWLQPEALELHAEWFGLKGDGVTDNSSRLQIATNAAIAAGATLVFGEGRFMVSSASLTALGSLRWCGQGSATIIDGTGHIDSGSGQDLGYGITISSELESPGRTASGTLYCGSNSFVLSSASGLSVGTELYLELGVDTIDPTQPFLRMFAKVATIVGNTVTLDNAVPEDINGTSHVIYKNLTPCKDLRISDMRFNMFSMSINRVQGGTVADVYVDRAVGLFLVTDSYGLTFERIQCDMIASAGAVGFSPNYGWFLQGWGHYGVYVRDIQIRNLAGPVFYSSEAQSRECFMENIRLGVTRGLSPASVALFVANSNTRPIVVRNLYLTCLDSSATRTLGGSETGFVFENVFITGNNPAGAAFVAVPPVNLYLSGTRGVVRLNNKIYSQRVPFRRAIKFAAGATGTNYDLGVKGMLSRCRIFVSSLTGITSIVHYNTTGAADVTASLTAGQFKNCPEATNIIESAPNAQTENRTFRVTLDGGQAAGSFAIIEGEVIQSSASLETQPEVKIGSGAPATAPAFFGQRYFDSTNLEMYEATDLTGTASADWTSLWQNRASAALVASKAAISGTLSSRIFCKANNVSTIESTTVDVLRFLDSGGTLVQARVVSGMLFLNASNMGNAANGASSKTYGVNWSYQGVGTPELTLLSDDTAAGTDPIASVAITTDSGGVPKIRVTTAAAAGTFGISACFVGLIAA